MKSLLGWVFCLPLLVVCSLGYPTDALSHGTGHDILQDAPLVALEFHYSDGMPMQYAEALVFSPQDPEVEHQNGRTDKHGRFVFCPDAQGAWLVKVNDGMGHLEQAAVEIDAQTLSGPALNRAAPAPPATDGGAAPSKALKIITGLSLILNAALVAFVLKRLNGKETEEGRRCVS
jgi:nickel transport protein